MSELEEKIADFKADLREVNDPEALIDLKEKYLGRKSHVLTYKKD